MNKYQVECAEPKVTMVKLIGFVAGGFTLLFFMTADLEPIFEVLGL